MASVSNQQFRTHFLLGFKVHGAEQRFDVSDGQSRNGLVADVFGKPGKMLVEHLGVFLFEQINQVHLSHYDHPSLVAVQAVDEWLVILVVHVQSLIAGNDACFGKFRDR